jgi:hypothetical protein
MIGDIFEFIIEILIDLLPNFVWKILLFVLGIIITAIGVTMLGESPLTGGALLVVGMLLGLSSLLSLLR